MAAFSVSGWRFGFQKDIFNMKLLLAVSGGIDSVVLLDMLVRHRSLSKEPLIRGLTGRPELVVAHFDHGIRQDSSADARFVAELAKKYNLPFVSRREELGRDVSEEKARERRYRFLQEAAKAASAVVTTAHHGDDVIETVALNLSRGTGWRGLAVLDRLGVFRPLLPYFKNELLSYAVENRLEWVEDSTNASDIYTRNRLRRQISTSLSFDAKKVIHDLWSEQVELKSLIDGEIESITNFSQEEFSRYFFINIDHQAAMEILRLIIINAGYSPIRPQLERALLMIKTARPGAKFELGDISLSFKIRTFRVTTKTKNIVI